MTKKILVILTLAIIIASVFLPAFVFADGQSYDVNVVVQRNGKNYRYRLLDNVSSLSPLQKTDREIYSSVRLKKILAAKMLKLGYTAEQTVNYLLPNFHYLVERLQAQTNYDAKDATCYFTKGQIQYTAESVGLRVDVDALYNAVIEQMSKKVVLEAYARKVQPSVTLSQLKERTALRCTFSTSFNPSNLGRSNNIAKALSNFDGLVVGNGERVSFNEVVGSRTAERGYDVAKIIIDGEYVDGVGGGVCQASTTLYNALLLAGVKINMRCRHSLASGYVKTGFDAMVNSGSADLIFTNDTEGELYIATFVQSGVATVNVYGMAKKYSISRESVIVERKEPQLVEKIDRENKYADRVKYDDETFVLQNGSPYIVAEVYLRYYDGQTLVKKVFLRRDTYFSAPRIVVRGASKRPLIEITDFAPIAEFLPQN